MTDNHWGITNIQAKDAIFKSTFIWIEFKGF